MAQRAGQPPVSLAALTPQQLWQQQQLELYVLGCLGPCVEGAEQPAPPLDAQA